MITTTPDTQADPFATLRQWAEQHALAGSNEWSEVVRLFAAYDQRGSRLMTMAERVQQQSEFLSRRAEK